MAADEYIQPIVPGDHSNRRAAIDAARRPISHYFQKVYSLYKAKMIDLTIVETVANKKQAKFYLDRFEVLEWAAGQSAGGYDESSFEFYAELYHLPRTKAAPTAGEPKP